MKFRIIALAAIIGCTLGASSGAMAQSRALKPNSATTVTNLRAPIPNGTKLSTLIATNPGNIALDTMISARANRTKKDPTGDPTTYSDLTFTELNPCRILDSRVSQGGDGPFMDGVSRIIKVGPYSGVGGGYATGPGAQGGSATSCGLDTLAAPGEVDAVMVAVSTFTQTGPGYLTFYSATAADPSATVVSVFYQAGPVQTAFVVMPTDALIPSSSAGISRFASTEVTLDIVGYFAKPHAVALECTTVGDPPSTVAAGAQFAITTPACAAGFTPTGALFFSSDSSNLVVVNSAVTDIIAPGAATCAGTNGTAAAADLACGVRCCRVLGR